MEAVMEPTVGTTSDTGRDSPDPKDLMLKISVGNSRKAGTWKIDLFSEDQRQGNHAEKDQLRNFLCGHPAEKSG